MIRALVLAGARLVLERSERARDLLAVLATAAPDVGRELLERLAGAYGAKLEIRE